MASLVGAKTVKLTSATILDKPEASRELRNSSSFRDSKSVRKSSRGSSKTVHRRDFRARIKL